MKAKKIVLKISDFRNGCATVCLTEYTSREGFLKIFLLCSRSYQNPTRFLILICFLTLLYSALSARAHYKCFGMIDREERDIYKTQQRREGGGGGLSIRKATLSGF